MQKNEKITAILIVTVILLGMLLAVVFAEDATSYDQYGNANALMYTGDDLLTLDLKDTSNADLNGDGAIINCELRL